MKIKNSFDNTNEFEDLILAQLRGIDNIELLILKGHILVEYALNKFIDAVSETDKSIEDTKFTFSHKIDICKMLGIIHNQKDGLEEQMVTLNKMRNQIAHTLSFDFKLLDTLSKYYSNNLNDLGTKSKEDISIFVRRVVVFLCGNIIGRLEAKRTIKKHSYADWTVIKKELGIE